MKIVAGLGNPGDKYEKTRHNAGFLALDFYLKNMQTISCQGKFNAQICEVHFGANKVFFVKPQTFMNSSGEAIRDIAQFYKLSPADILVIHDEVDLPFGTVRTVQGSSGAGHNGVQNVIDSLGTKDFTRVRIGVESRESREQMPTDAFVLSPFTEEELAKLENDIFPGVKMEIDSFLKI